MTVYQFVKWFVFGPITHLLCRFEVSGQENLPKEGGYILASNHLKWYDPVLLAVWWPVQVSFAAKIQLYRVPGLRWLMVHTEQIPLERERASSPGVFRELLKQAQERMNRGLVFGLFPEGTRSKDGQLGAFRRGAFRIASASKRPVVPVGISYVRRGPRLVMRIAIGEPVESSGHSARDLTSDLERRIAALSGQELASDHAD